MCSLAAKPGMSSVERAPRKTSQWSAQFATPLVSARDRLAKKPNCDVLMVQKEKLERLKEILSRTSLDQIEKALEQDSESLPSAP